MLYYLLPRAVTTETNGLLPTYKSFELEADLVEAVTV